MALSVGFGVAGSIAGLYLSYWLDVASGATIVLIETAIFLAVLALGPRSGLFRPRRLTPATR
jgi:manganese/iron transport system permease protein